MTTSRPEVRQASVLVARTEDRAAGLVERLRAAGVRVTSAPVIERAPVEDTSRLQAARELLAAGWFEWVVITSVNAVDALLGRPVPVEADPADAGPVAHPDWIPGETRWAAVGPATERALARHGLRADLVPETMTAAGLAETFPPAPEDSTDGALLVFDGVPEATRAVLLPLGDLVGDSLPRALAAKGWEPHVVTAYRTVAHELPADFVGQAYDLVVVASGSAARQVAAQLGPGRAVVAIGEPSARVARAAGLDVVATAAQPTDESLADAVLSTLAARTAVAGRSVAARTPSTAPTTKEYP
ncbi:uroporphyrinogen-III synthase [Antribacter gilvus]|uniref:uroporphyrinogen-III synthase n=1 Tax=Antribacter gilvus TaxID=2304675 RepID=UPI000F79E5C5|nr:uroporphyrinogen-III synthase [Antribacter gilvus]